ncbi:MAG: GspE/PulE family protein [bacterium]|nr:GspE/PulE family protein [bacterium]
MVAQNVKKIEDFQREISDLISNAPATNDNIIKLANKIIRYALEKKASDIHIEPRKEGANLRFRIDGNLQTMLNIPNSVFKPVIARFKILANLRLDEYRYPQDGRIEPEEFPDTSLRVSTMPTLFGEKIVFRVLDDSNKNLSLSALGFSEEQKKIILNNIEKPFGVIVASGPTGSGKTTTLYAILQAIKKEGLNISTLEDPVEYVLSGVNQTQINPQSKLTFPSGLRALLRQDPDIIMVGEIRDSETSVMATNAAMTGHLVLTTIHTNDAPSSFIRFLEMKVEDFVVANTINLVVAQRLVRKICPLCAKKRKLEPTVLKKIRERKDIMAALEKKKKGLSKNIENHEFSIGAGCDQCLGTGYSGRIGIFELLESSKEINNLILNNKSTEEIRISAEKNGFKDMVSDGIEKAFSGITTFDEVLRTTKNS